VDFRSDELLLDAVRTMRQPKVRLILAARRRKRETTLIQ
jgi:hypothetical protein